MAIKPTKRTKAQQLINIKNEKPAAFPSNNRTMAYLHKYHSQPNDL